MTLRTRFVGYGIVVVLTATAAGCAMFNHELAKPEHQSELTYDDVATRMMNDARQLASNGDYEGSIALSERARELPNGSDSKSFPRRNRPFRSQSPTPPERGDRPDRATSSSKTRYFNSRNSKSRDSYSEAAEQMMAQARELADRGDYEGASVLAKRARALQSQDDKTRFVAKNETRASERAPSKIAERTSRPTQFAKQGPAIEFASRQQEDQQIQQINYEQHPDDRRDSLPAIQPGPSKHSKAVQAALSDATPQERSAVLKNLQGADPDMVDQVLRERRRVAQMGLQSVVDSSDQYNKKVARLDQLNYVESSLQAPDPRTAAGRYGLGTSDPWSQGSFKSSEQVPIRNHQAVSHGHTDTDRPLSDSQVRPIDSDSRRERTESGTTPIPTQVARPKKNLVRLGGVTLSGSDEQEPFDTGLPPRPSNNDALEFARPTDARQSSPTTNQPSGEATSANERSATNEQSEESGRFFSQLPGKDTILQAPSTLKSAIYNAGQGIRNGLRGDWLGGTDSNDDPNPAKANSGDRPQNAPNANNVAKLATVNPADGPWAEKLKRLIRQAEDEVARSKPGTTDQERQNHIAGHVQLRMLYLIAGQFELALQPVPGIEENEQEFWQQMFWGMSSYFDSQGMPNAEDRAAETIAQLRLATARLEEKARLRIRTAAFSRKIQGFGDFEDIERNVFSPGQPILVYAEIANFKSEPTADGKFRSVLKSTIEVARAGENGEILDRTELPAVEDTCKSVRRDYFNSYKYTIPPQATLGRHVLILTVEDKLSRKVARYRLNFTIE